ncbi:MAG: xanthine dehydrogenase family protein subunit M [Hyphomicrobiales bacterium]|nr:xanthine dehydrogenase family protein subunit M [Hyphomicrobiales bacterium]
MKPAPFKYLAARSLEEALALKAEHGEDARFLAGGQSLVPAMNFRLAQPDVLIDINPLADLAEIRRSGGTLRIGALVRHRTIERDAVIAACHPLLREAAKYVAHPQIRNRGTFGGNLAHADPASEFPAVVLALAGRLRARSKAGERFIDAGDFFIGPLATGLRADEMLVEVELADLLPRTGACFLEIARRRGDFALAGVAATVTVGDAGVCIAARLACCGAGDRPILAAEAGRSLVGTHLAAGDIDAAAVLAERAVDPPGNLHAGKDYQRHLIGVLTRRALNQARERAHTVRTDHDG